MPKSRWRPTQRRPPFASGGVRRASSRSTSASTPAPPSSSPLRRTCTARTSRPAKPNPNERNKVVILGSGPNRIGQGIEFDYCCCHAAFALREEGFETVMINCNPETVSTDYDTADRLYFRAADLRRRDGGDRDRAERPAVTSHAWSSSAARRRSSCRSRCRKRA